MQKTLATLYIIFAAFVFSSLIYLIVGFSLSRAGWKPMVTSSNAQNIIFGFFVAASAGLLFVALKFKANAFSRGAAPLEGNPELTRTYLLSKYIVLYAIAEIPAIFGLVYFMLSGRFFQELILCLSSIVIFLMVRPKMDSVETTEQRDMNEVKREM